MLASMVGEVYKNQVDVLSYTVPCYRPHSSGSLAWYFILPYLPRLSSALRFAPWLSKSEATRADPVREASCKGDFPRLPWRFTVFVCRRGSQGLT